MLLKDKYLEEGINSISSSVINFSNNSPIAIFALYETISKYYYQQNIDNVILDLVNNLASDKYFDIHINKGLTLELNDIVLNENKKAYNTLRNEFLEYYISLLAILFEDRYILINERKHRFSWKERDDIFNNILIRWGKSNQSIKMDLGIYLKCYNSSKSKILFFAYKQLGILNRYFSSFDSLKKNLSFINIMFKEQASNIGETFQNKLDILLPYFFESFINNYENHMIIGKLLGYFQGTFAIEEFGEKLNSKSSVKLTKH